LLTDFRNFTQQNLSFAVKIVKKLNSNLVKTYMPQKNQKIFNQSGVVPYRLVDGRIEVLLITTRKSDNWVIPKGGIPQGMSPRASAAKEAWEEAGVIGQAESRKLGTYKYRKKGKTYRVKMYPLPVEAVSKSYPELGKRHRVWLDVEQAASMVKTASLKRILKRFSKITLAHSGFR
jgi:8-oxo-dGTP pyrophosphatase MutT (NUDIX family)